MASLFRERSKCLLYCRRTGFLKPSGRTGDFRQGTDRARQEGIRRPSQTGPARVSQESKIQITRKAEESSLALNSARSALVARGLRDAAADQCAVQQVRQTKGTRLRWLRLSQLQRCHRREMGWLRGN